MVLPLIALRRNAEHLCAKASSTKCLVPFNFLRQVEILCSLRALLGELCLYRQFRDACSRNLRDGWDANALTRLDVIEIAQVGVEFMNFLQKLRITFSKVVHAYPEQGLSWRHANCGSVGFRLLILDWGCVGRSR